MSNKQSPAFRVEVRQRSPFARWQGRAIEQLGFVNNLLIVLATALLGFEAQLEFADKIVLSATERTVAELSLIALFLSLTFGIAVALVRLHDLHRTSQIVRKRTKRDRAKSGNQTQKYQNFQKEIKKLRKSVRRWGRATWWLLASQLFIFLLGTCCLLTLALLRVIQNH
jgi:hypothetical protein